MKFWHGKQQKIKDFKDETSLKNFCIIQHHDIDKFLLIRLQKSNYYGQKFIILNFSENKGLKMKFQHGRYSRVAYIYVRSRAKYLKLRTTTSKINTLGKLLMQQKYYFIHQNVALEKFYKVMLCSCKSVISSKCYVNLFYRCKAVLYDQSSGQKN